LILSRRPTSVSLCDETTIAQESDKVLSIEGKVPSIEAKNLSKGDKGKKMNDVLEAHSLFIQAFPERRFPSVKDMLCEAVDFMAPRLQKKFTYRRARSIWEKKALRIDGEEKDALRQAVIEEERREQRELRARLAQLDESLAAIDQAQAGQSVAEIRAQAGRLGGVHYRGSAK
jgi:hypothetical protein